MISVIIPTLNRSDLLFTTLRSITKQSLPIDDFEILVIDNGSKDDTQKVVSNFQSSFRQLKYVQETNPGLHSGRHRGLAESKGDILVFADDDIEALPTWLEGIQESFENNDTGLVGGKNIPNYESQPPQWVDELWETYEEGRYITYFSLLDFGDAVKEINPHFVFGCNFAIRKNLLLQIKGFHPDGMPQSLIKFRGDGETHVATQVQELGFRTIYNPKASIKHWVPSSRMNMEYIQKRAFSEGITQSFIDTRKKKILERQVFPPSLFAKYIKEKISGFFLSDVRKQIRSSFRDGYNFHQSELKKDKDLLQWVLKDNYLTPSS